MPIPVPDQPVYDTVANDDPTTVNDAPTLLVQVGHIAAALQALDARVAILVGREVQLAPSDIASISAAVETARKLAHDLRQLVPAGTPDP